MPEALPAVQVVVVGVVLLVVVGVVLLLGAAAVSDVIPAAVVAAMSAAMVVAVVVTPPSPRVGSGSSSCTCITRPVLLQDVLSYILEVFIDVTCMCRKAWAAGVGKME